jgi:antirestriction protein ArdC
MLDIAQTITDSIIQQLEKGATPWVKPWRSLRGLPGNGNPYNARKCKPYRGANYFHLLQQPWENPGYVTFKQAIELGGNVKAGQKGTPVIYWNIQQKTGKDSEGNDAVTAVPFLKHYWVFNVEQCENLTLPEIEKTPEPDWNPESNVMALVDRLALAGGLTHSGDSAYFRPSTDAIVMPAMAAFNSPENYHATLLHESIHATGHDSRLKRLTPARFGSEEYAYEELVAELGAAMLCSQCGINGDLRHAGYIESWLKALKNDKKFILSASAKAQQAMDFLIKTEQVEPEQNEALAA